MCPLSTRSPFSSDGMPTGVGPDGMALPPGAAPVVPEAPPAPPVTDCNDLDFNLDNVDKVRHNSLFYSCVGSLEDRTPSDGGECTFSCDRLTCDPYS